MSTQTPDRAQVIPLRPAVAPATPAADRVRAEHRRAPVPAAGRGRTLLRGPLPGPTRLDVNRSRVVDREPLWRHVVGDVLRRERLAQSLRLKDVAESARISMPYLSEIERGRKEASSEVLAAAARALGLGLADLLELAQADLARFAAARRPAAGDPVRPARGPGAERAVPAGESDPQALPVPESDPADDAAAPAGRIGNRQAEALLAAPLRTAGPARPRRTGPPQVRMSLAA